MVSRQIASAAAHNRLPIFKSSCGRLGSLPTINLVIDLVAAVLHLGAGIAQHILSFYMLPVGEVFLSNTSRIDGTSSTWLLLLFSPILLSAMVSSLVNHCTKSTQLISQLSRAVDNSRRSELMFPRLSGQHLADHLSTMAEADPVCCICLEPLISGNCRLLPCHHLLHDACLSACLGFGERCPICRASFFGSNPENQHQQQRQHYNNHRANNAQWQFGFMPFGLSFSVRFG